MWETFISWYLNTYLGQYVENLNSEQLSFALRQGKLELDNVPIKKSIFRTWGLPIEVRSSVVGKIRIEFDILKYFRSEPVIVTIEDVIIVAGPIKLEEWDPIEEAALAHAMKMNALDSHEARWKAQMDLLNDSSTYYSSLYISSLKIGASIVTKLVENIYLNVKNVHVRFEDTTKRKGIICALGVRLGNLTAQNCNENFVPVPSGLNATPERSYKIVSLERFSVYFDVNCAKLSDTKPEHLKSQANECLVSHSYVLAPASMDIRIVKNNMIPKVPGPDKPMLPRFDVRVSISKVQMNLSNLQFKCMNKMFHQTKHLHKCCRMRHYRPYCCVTTGAKDWWKYALRAILFLRGYKRRKSCSTWEEALDRAKRNKAYVCCYKKHLQGEFLQLEDQKIKDEVEMYLHFDEIVELREVAMRKCKDTLERKDKDNKSSFNVESIEKTSSEGIVSWLLPSWRTSSSSGTSHEPHQDLRNENTIELPSSQPNANELSSAILDDVKTFQKDLLLATFVFVLHSGSVGLLKRNSKIIELEFGGLRLDSELKPKSGNHNFKMVLSNFRITDCFTKKEVVGSNKLATKHFSFQSGEQGISDSLFNINYEKCPHKRAGHKIVVCSRPISIRLSPILWNDLWSFFDYQKEEYFQPVIGYESLGKKTAEELRQYWDRFLYSKNISNARGWETVWEIDFDIFAPQIVFSSEIRQKLKENQSIHRSGGSTKLIHPVKPFLVIDLGRFQFSNHKNHHVQNDTDISEDSEDEFATPLSSPLPEEIPSDNNIISSIKSEKLIAVGSSSSDSESKIGVGILDLQDQLYKKYQLQITDVQVIIGDNKSNREASWKLASNRGSSAIHLVDRLSISVKLERRLLYSDDPLWPALKIEATLPKLNLHLSEQKLNATREIISSYFNREEHRMHERSLFGSNTSLTDIDNSLSSNSNVDISKKIDQLVVAKISIEKVSVEIQSQGRSLAELQVFGATAVIETGVTATDVTFILNNLLLADAIQTFGPDFQLLLASHKHVCMDSISGSLKDSEPTSPVSPSSPPVAEEDGSNSHSFERHPVRFHNAVVTTLQKRRKASFSSNSGYSDASLTKDPEALIVAELKICHIDDNMVILNVQCNNLDLVGNQDTLIQILRFVQNVLPRKSSSYSSETSKQDEHPLQLNADINFEFKRLNLLLLRSFMERDGNHVARKIATATASDSKFGLIQENGCMRLKGCLGGLQVINLTPEGKSHQRVLSVGQDPLVTPEFNPCWNKGGVLSQLLDASSALTFLYEKNNLNPNTHPKAKINMASVIYVHSTPFLLDIQHCISQFKAPLATKLKTAAAHLAYELVRQEPLSHNISLADNFSLGSHSNSVEHLDVHEETGPSSLPSTIEISVVLESPVVVLPKCCSSPNVLVANLGRITVNKNMPKSKEADEVGADGDEIGENCIVYSVLITDVSMYSLSLIDRWEVMRNFKLTFPHVTCPLLIRAQDLYSCDSDDAHPILHNTVLHFKLKFFKNYCSNMTEQNLERNEEADYSKLEIMGRVVNSLKVSLTSSQYAQILQSLSSMSVGNRDCNYEDSEGFRDSAAPDGDSPYVVPHPSPTKVTNSLFINGTFELPEVIIELLPFQSSSLQNTTPLLAVWCSELNVRFERIKNITDLDMSLKSLLIEDRNPRADSKTKIVAISKTVNHAEKLDNNETNNTADFSLSAPNLKNETLMNQNSSKKSRLCAFKSNSLPEDISSDFLCHNPSMTDESNSTPSRILSVQNPSQYSDYDLQGAPNTPPPSPRAEFNDSENSENLVHINVKWFDQSNPNFFTAHQGINRAVNVDFNELELTMNPIVLNCLQRFFADSSENEKQDRKLSKDLKYEDLQNSEKQEDAGRDSVYNSENSVNIRRLSLRLGQNNALLLQASVEEISFDLKRRGEDYFGVEGKLGRLEIRDITPYSGFHPIKFTFQGHQALDFDYYRKGNEAKLRLEMSSIICVHTNRFYREFMSLYSALFESNEVLDGQVLEKEKTEEKASSNVTKVFLNIQADAPVLILPYSFASNNVLLAYLGKLCVKNKFSESETFGVNVIDIDLLDMDVFCGNVLKSDDDGCIPSSDDRQISWGKHNQFYVKKAERSSASFLTKKCALKLQYRKLLFGAPSDSEHVNKVYGTLSALECYLDSEKYKLIRGLLMYNLGETLEPLTLICARSTNRTPIWKYSYPEEAQETLSVELDLVNVGLELIGDQKASLCRIDFIKSKFTMINKTDGTKDIDLASTEILIRDSRAENLDKTSSSSHNFFEHILKPSGKSYHTIHKQKKKNAKKISEDYIQAELHYRINRKGTEFTIVLNSMRVMLILDWWVSIKNFLSQDIPPVNAQIGLNEQEFTESKTTASRDCDPKRVLSNECMDVSTSMVVSTGIVTKRAAILDMPSSTFELKCNISGCELILVDNPSEWDSNAVILKTTALFTYQPHLDNPVSCSLMEFEIFTCLFGLENETALSILDPTNLHIEVVSKGNQETKGILDATISYVPSAKTLRFTSANITLRLSYYDMKLFLQMVNKFSKDAIALFVAPHSEEPVAIEAKNAEVNELSIKYLMDMGFDQQSARTALHSANGDIDRAVESLSSFDHYHTNKQNAAIVGSSSGSEAPAQWLKGFEVSCHYYSICVIDDCKDADVPLLDLSISQLTLTHNQIDNTGQAEGIFTGDYYNRELSGWEPFLEPWKCCLRWSRHELGALGRTSPSKEFPSKAPQLELDIISNNVMNINITSSILSLLEVVRHNWTQDYEKKVDKRRCRFVPFLLKNETGSPLKFYTSLATQENHNEEINLDGTKEICVPHGSSQQFSFESRGKLRHKSSHLHQTHQLVVRVEGWQQTSPVSVDKVGTYYRSIQPDISRSRSRVYNAELPEVWLVFHVKLLGSAQKMISVRSSLTVNNILPDAVELRLENTITYPAYEKAQMGGSFTVKLDPFAKYHVPLHSVWANMWVRPMDPSSVYGSGHKYCSKPLVATNSVGGFRECYSLAVDSEQPYRFCINAVEEEFQGVNPFYSATMPSTAQLLSSLKRVSSLTIKSPLTLYNLLPIELSFELSCSISYSGRISGGALHYVTKVNPTEAMDFVFKIENFQYGATLKLSSHSNAVYRVKTSDASRRQLILIIRVIVADDTSLAVHVSSPIWIVNKSGLPLVFRQEDARSEAAGQFEEHEVARMMTPLLFSFSDSESPSTLSVRVGTGLHKEGHPHWCKPLTIHKGSKVRKLNVALSNSRPEIVYTLGFEMKVGKGRYRDTRLVTVSPQFMVDNRSAWKLKIAQKAYANCFFDAAAEKTHLSLPSTCNLPFHWPRLDKEQLLCVKIIETQQSYWSGGFPISNVDSFQINVRNFDGGCHFLRVEIILKGSTFFVVFSDTVDLPPPFRIDNLSLVPITFHQACVEEQLLMLTVEPESSLPYALDEPTLEPIALVSVPDGDTCSINFNILESSAELFYEDLFYIVCTDSFENCEGMKDKLTELVLDVIDDTKVVLRKREEGKRSQLWQIKPNGLIEHEDSSIMKGLSGSHGRKENSAISKVLDIEGQAPNPSQYVKLMLRKPDKRRIGTQHWEFTKEGRLKLCMYGNLFVQVKDAFESDLKLSSSQIGIWNRIGDIVLGPSQPVNHERNKCGIPVEQAISRRKLRPGSGNLQLTIETDGPTRLLRIKDPEFPPSVRLLHHTFEESSQNTSPKCLLTVDFKEGIGLSLVNSKPREELIYALLRNFNLSWMDSAESEILQLSVGDIQVDNQLFESEKSAVLFITNPSLYQSTDNFSLSIPVSANLCWQRMKSNLNANVFKNFDVALKPLTLILEEKLFLKLIQFFEFDSEGSSDQNLLDSDFEIQKALVNATSSTSKRYYFGIIKILLEQVRLSVFTSSKLSEDLLAVKRRLGLSLIQFEEAQVDLDPFIRCHPFETFDFMLSIVLKHYKDELVSQAAVILGSTDFLGNPLGFVNDFTAGFSGLIYEGSIGSLVKNVTHGISNSAAKVTGTLGEGLGKTILDERHEEERRKIKEEKSTSGSQLYAGLYGFGHGLLGGVTSVVSQSYEGLSNDGFTGLFTGFGKGIVGTVTKPAVGVLDLASGAASALRDTSRSSSRMIPKRLRPIRVATGAGGLLPLYSKEAALNQQSLYNINDRNYEEQYLACESFKTRSTGELKIIISTKAVMIINPGKNGNQITLHMPLEEIKDCSLAPRDKPYKDYPFIEFIRSEDNFSVCKPHVMCENEQVAIRIVRHVKEAVALYHELLLTKNTSQD